MGDVFSVLWEPEMIRETGSALRIMTAEILSQIGQTVLAATAMTALMTALQWPISKRSPSCPFLQLMPLNLVLTKLGYLIDNPWSNALDRAKAAGSVLADVLIQRHLGVRPITLIGYSLGARVIFYALLELAKQKAYGIVQDVILLGATLTASQKTWIQVRSVVSGRFLNGFARTDWVLNYLFRATSGGVGTVAGLRPVENVPGLENIDVTDKISGHMSYRTFMPLIMDQLGFPVSADHFDEPEVRFTLGANTSLFDCDNRPRSNPTSKRIALLYGKERKSQRRAGFQETSSKPQMGRPQPHPPLLPLGKPKSQINRSGMIVTYPRAKSTHRKLLHLPHTSRDPTMLLMTSLNCLCAQALTLLR